MPVLLVLIIIGCVVFLVYSSTKKKQEEIKKAEEKQEEMNRCRAKCQELKGEIQETYNKNAKIQWGRLMRSSTIERLVAARFYHNSQTNDSFLSINIDNSGRKCLYKERDGKFVQVQIEDDDPVRRLTVTVNLAEEPSASAIESFNNMERLMPDLMRLPQISFSFPND